MVKDLVAMCPGRMFCICIWTGIIAPRWTALQDRQNSDRFRQFSLIFVRGPVGPTSSEADGSDRRETH